MKSCWTYNPKGDIAFAVFEINYWFLERPDFAEIVETLKKMMNGLNIRRDTTIDIDENTNTSTGYTYIEDHSNIERTNNYYIIDV